MNGHRSTLSRPVLCQGCAFWGLEYLIFTFLPIFHQKSSKLSQKSAISSKNAQTWNIRYFRNYTTERRENLTQSWEHKMEFYYAIWWRHNKSKMAYWKSFLAISQRHIDGSTQNMEHSDEESHADIGHVTKTAIFANSRWQTATIFKISLSPYHSCVLSDFHQVCYVDADFHS